MVQRQQKTLLRLAQLATIASICHGFIPHARTGLSLTPLPLRSQPVCMGRGRRLQGQPGLLVKAATRMCMGNDGESGEPNKGLVRAIAPNSAAARPL